MKTKLTLFIYLFSVISILAQPDISWQNNYGGSASDNSYSIIQTNDGGYAIAGYTMSHNSGDVSEQHNGQQHVWVVKTDSQGVIEWEKAYGGSNYERAYSIKQTSDNGYIVAGLTASVDGDITEYFGYEDIWVLKLDATGNLEWQKSYGDDNNEQVWEILQTTDGGYVMAGNSWINTSHSDFIVKKIDSNGNLEWQNIFGYDNNGSEDYARSIKQTSDGGYIVAGKTLVLEEQLNTSDYWVVKLDTQGAIEWDTKLGGSNVEEAWNVQQTAEGGYIVVGYSYSNDSDVTGNHGMEDIWVVKLNSFGFLEWQKSYGGSRHDRATSIIQTSNGDFIFAGFTDSLDGDITGGLGNYDGWLVKINSFGNVLWQKILGGSDQDALRAVVQTTDGGYALTGSTQSNDTGAGTLNGNYDFWVIKFGAETLEVNDYFSEDFELTVYPNPTASKIDIITDLEIENVSMYNALGEIVSETKYVNQIDASQLSKGIYLLKLETNKGEITIKVIIN